MAKEFFLTFFVITDPAPIKVFSFIVTGATKDVFEPINALLLILVLLFLIMLSFL